MADQPSTSAAAASPTSAGGSPSAHVVPQQVELVAAPDSEGPGDDDDDALADSDSALGDDAASSTNSITASIMEYRTIQGRTYHSEKHNSKYFTPNDEQQLQSQDITHHYLTLLLGDKIFLAPIPDNVEKVLDIGTGSGIWAIDFADQYPNAEVIGTDLSPTQPLWVPPNVKFELDDCTQPWTWQDGTFDFVHIRYLFGAIADWNELFRQAYRVTKPGGWVQSCEADAEMLSDDNTIAPDSSIELFWNMLYRSAGKKLGVTFQPIQDDVQVKAFEAAGFEDIQSYTYKFPIGGWPQDKTLQEVGQYVQLTMLNDVEGYTLFLWNTVMGENAPGYQEFLAYMRKDLKNKRIHSYMKCRYVFGRKPGTASA
ncbi:S-adenosyl-L-methionine-dependent methyltransferase [Hypoxylon rubiginosum]|uniref:S-adenosyl-L-methionine-dependent methyltransferase n=1 Tax=Hypoxylon rubiginosum TaxID=110542 RepID=A0ACB9YQW7_9PEZI|nr:S-adenosyl-L-methionine-dependent methyltransferase [Hypoxylon rubiginosum]